MGIKTISSNTDFNLNMTFGMNSPKTKTTSVVIMVCVNSLPLDDSI